MSRPGLVVAVAIGCSAATPGCGRVGYELLALDGNGGDGGAGSGGASVGGSSGATTGGSTNAGGTGGTGGASASGGVQVEAGPDTSVAGSGSGGASPDGGPDAATPEAGLDASTCVPATTALDYCATLPRLCAPPVIDGMLDPGAPLRDLVPVGWNNTTTPLPAGSAARYSAAWREDGLYVFVEVTDATRVPAPAGEEVWRGDGVEIYVDADGVFTAPPAFDNPGTRQIQAAAPVDATTPSTRGEVYTWGFAGTRVPWTSGFVVVPTSSGYVLEAFITVAEMAIPSFALSAGGVVGFDLGINVSDPDTTTFQAPDGHRLGQYFLQLTGTTPPFFDVRAFCLPALAP